MESSIVESTKNAAAEIARVPVVVVTAIAQDAGIVGQAVREVVAGAPAPPAPAVVPAVIPEVVPSIVPDVSSASGVASDPALGATIPPVVASPVVVPVA